MAENNNNKTMTTASPPPPPVVSPPLPMIPVPQAIEVVLTETSRAIWYDRRWRSNDASPSPTSSSSSSSATTLPAKTHQHPLIGRISARDILAPSPGYPNHYSSIMDGYAIKIRDLEHARVTLYYDGMDPVVRKGEEHYLDFVIVGKVYAGDDVVEDDDSNFHNDSNDESHQRTAVYVTTGAVVPTNYDAVIPIEDTELLPLIDDGDANELRRIRIIPSKIKSILQSTKRWTWIRTIGCDIPPGLIVLSRGEKIQPVHMALLSQVGVGLETVPVNRLPRVGVLSTGNELVYTPYSSAVMINPPTQPRGKIPDANRPLLLTQLSTYGNCIPVDLGIATDDEEYEHIARRIAKVLWPEDEDDHDDNYIMEGVDVLITTGGVSMGEKDIMESVFVQGMGGKVHFGRLNMKPGKPTTFITIDKELKNGSISRKLVFALPGNPVSASVCAELLVRPCLDLIHTGVNSETFSENLEEDIFIEHHVNNARVHEEIMATITSDIELDPGRPEYRRVALSRVSCNVGGDRHQYKYHATCIGVQRSSRVLSLRGADGMMILPRAGTLTSGNTARKGMEFPVLLYSQLSMSSSTRFKDSIHRDIWKSMQHDEPRRTIVLGIIVTSNSDADDNNLCTTLVTLFGGDTKVTVVKRIRCQLDNMLPQQLPDIIGGPQMDGVNLIIVLVPSNPLASSCSLSFKAGLEVAHALRPILRKNAPALAQKIRLGAASQDPMAALFENVIGIVRGNSSLLVTCTDLGLAGAVNAFKGLIDPIVSNSVSPLDYF